MAALVTSLSNNRCVNFETQAEMANFSKFLICNAKDSQKIKIKKKTKTPRITDEGWNSQKRLSDPVEKKMKEGKRRKKRLLYLHLKLSLGLVPL